MTQASSPSARWTGSPNAAASSISTSTAKKSASRSILTPPNTRDSKSALNCSSGQRSSAPIRERKSNSMRLFKNMPIKRKLTMIILVVCASVLMLSEAATITTELVAARQQLVENMNVLADLLGRYSTAPLSFHRDEDADEVTKTLAAIEADPHILIVCLYDKDHKRFGEYARAGASRDFPAQPPADGHRFVSDYLELSQPVELDQKRIGTIYL